MDKITCKALLNRYPLSSIGYLEPFTTESRLSLAYAAAFITGGQLLITYWIFLFHVYVQAFIVLFSWIFLAQNPDFAEPHYIMYMYIYDHMIQQTQKFSTCWFRYKNQECKAINFRFKRELHWRRMPEVLSNFHFSWRIFVLVVIFISSRIGFFKNWVFMFELIHDLGRVQVSCLFFI